jgi:hypothetical protein
MMSECRVRSNDRLSKKSAVAVLALSKPRSTAPRSLIDENLFDEFRRLRPSEELVIAILPSPKICWIVSN